MYFIPVQDLKKTTESKSINNQLQVDSKYLGLVNYEAALETQYKYHKLAVNDNKLMILGLEHPAVITLGYRADLNQSIVTGTVPTVKIERGGLATLHSEGQLVIYPIINLKKNNLGVRDFVSILLDCTKQLLLEHGIECSCSPDAAVGLFTPAGKIAFCGIQVKNGTSLHGISLNVSNDLHLFDNIVSCGVARQNMDSLKLHGKTVGLEPLFNRWCEIFSYNILNRQERSQSC